MNKTHYHLTTTFEGRLRAKWRRERWYYVLFDALSKTDVVCYFPDKLKEKALRLVRDYPPLKRRVAVYGKAKYSREDKPVSIVVKSVNRLPGKDEIVRSEELKGVDITESKSGGDNDT